MPLRVSVVGNSTGMMVSGVEPDGPPYAVLLEHLLAEAGQDAQVWNHSRWFTLLDTAVADWERTVLAAWPDLVVLQFGVNECRSALIPRRLARTRWTMSRTGTHRNRVWRKSLDLAFDPLSAALMSVEPAWMPGYMSAGRFGRLLDVLVGVIGVQTTASVAVLDVHPTTRILESLSPHYEIRRARLQALIDETVARHPHVYRVEIAPLMAAAGGDRAALPDGFHYSPAMHRLVAEEIASGYRRLRAAAGTAAAPAPAASLASAPR